MAPTATTTEALHVRWPVPALGEMIASQWRDSASKLRQAADAADKAAEANAREGDDAADLAGHAFDLTEAAAQSVLGDAAVATVALTDSKADRHRGHDAQARP